MIDRVSAQPRAGYWQYETSGALRPAVVAYLNGETMTAGHIWMDGDWRGPSVAALRESVRALDSRAMIDRWLDRAIEQGVDPL